MNYPNQRGGSHWNGPGRDRGPAPEDVESIDLSGICLGTGPLSPHLFSTHAEEAARAVSGAAKEMNKASQLRRFYDELVMWQERVGTQDAKFTEHEPYIRMLKAKAAYAKGRKHVDANFRALFDRLIDQSTNAATLRQAKLFFEAFMAYYKIYRAQ